MINIANITQNGLQTINPTVNAVLHKYDGYTRLPGGIQKAKYITSNIKVRVQSTTEKMSATNSASPSPSILRDMNEIGKVYKSFFVLSDSITPINQNINTAGDYIQVDNLYYRIIQIKESYNTGWQHLIGIQGASL